MGESNETFSMEKLILNDQSIIKQKNWEIKQLENKFLRMYRNLWLLVHQILKGNKPWCLQAEY